MPRFHRKVLIPAFVRRRLLHAGKIEVMAATPSLQADAQPRTIDRRTRARFVRMLKAFSASEVGGRARWLFAVLLVLLLVINGLNVLNSYVGRDFMTALERRETSRFIRQAFAYVGVFAFSTAAAVFLRFREETLALAWREWLSRWAVRRYLKPPVYRRLSDRLIANGEVANPDQRIADDVRAFTATTLSFVLLLLNAAFTVAAFSVVMWSISSPLFVVAVLYAGAGSFLTIVLGRPLVGLNIAQLDKEADFRAELISRPGERRPGGARAPRRAVRSAPPASGRRPRDQLPPDHRREPSVGVLYDRVQLPDPDHPGTRRRPSLHPP